MRTQDDDVAEPQSRAQVTEIRLPRYAYGLSLSLAVVALATGVTTFALRGVLDGTLVMNGSARGTALIMFAVAVPCLLVSMWFTARGSARGVFV